MSYKYTINPQTSCKPPNKFVRFGPFTPPKGEVPKNFVSLASPEMLAPGKGSPPLAVASSSRT